MSRRTSAAGTAPAQPAHTPQPAGSGSAEPPGGPIDAEQRWRLMLGVDEGLGELSEPLRAMDRALAAVYDAGDDGAAKGRGGLGGSAPSVTRWLGDIRAYFPNRVVRVMQTDAIERLGIRSLLTEPEVLETLEPDVHLVATLASLSKVIPERSRATARAVVDRVVKDVEKRIADRIRQSVTGALNRASRTSRPRPGDIDWNRTIAANLGHYLPEHRTVVPERLVGYGRRHLGVQREFTICLDQSGSMATSVVYASIMAGVMASLRSLRTSLVAYSTDVVDLTEALADPVDVIFGTQLGGGTNTSPALEYCRRTITRPSAAVLVLISDLYDFSPERMLEHVARIQGDGVQVVVLLALSDDGLPSYNHKVAASLGAMGVPAFGCTPDAFPGLIAAAIQGDDLGRWAEQQASQ